MAQNLASRVMLQALQYSSAELLGICKQTTVKVKVNNNVWNKIKQLNIAKPQRGCSGQLKLLTVKNLALAQFHTEITQFTLHAKGCNSYNLIPVKTIDA